MTQLHWLPPAPTDWRARTRALAADPAQDFIGLWADAATAYALFADAITGRPRLRLDPARPCRNAREQRQARTRRGGETGGFGAGGIHGHGDSRGA